MNRCPPRLSCRDYKNDRGDNRKRSANFEKGRVEIEYTTVHET
jgi:hypothetical protein